MGTGFRYEGGRGNAKPYTTLNALSLHQENERLIDIFLEIRKVYRVHKILKQGDLDIDTILDLVEKALQPYHF